MPQDFKFNEEQNLNQFRGSSRQQKPFLVRLVFKLSGGKIKNTKQANMILLGVVVLCIFIFLLLIINGGESRSLPDSPSPSELPSNYD